MWSGRPRLLPLTLILTFASAKNKKGAPFLASFAKEPALSLSKGGNHGRLQRRVRHHKRTLVIPNGAKGPVRNLLLTFAATAPPVWNGHSCPLPLTLILLLIWTWLTWTNREEHDLQPSRKSAPPWKSGA